MKDSHDLKSWPGPFKAIRDGHKVHEFRKDDRGFKVGDVLRLQEYDPDGNGYTGEVLLVTVTYITRGGPGFLGGIFGVPDDYCVMSIRVL